MTGVIALAVVAALVGVWWWRGRPRLFRVASVTAIAAAPCAVFLGSWWCLVLFVVAMYVARSAYGR